MSQEAVAGEKRERLPGESIRITGLTAGLAALFLLLRLLAVDSRRMVTVVSSNVEAREPLP